VQVDAGREWRGGQNQVRLLCQGLAARGDVDVQLVTRVGSELARRTAAAGVTVRGVPWRLSWDPRAALALTRILATDRPDVVHIHDAHALAMARWALRFSGRSGRTALVATRRVDFHLRRPSSWITCHAILAVSHAVKRVLVADGVPARLVLVIPDAVAPDEILRAASSVPNVRAQLGLPAGVPLAVNVAALVPHKDQITLVRAAAAAREQRPDLHWVIAGEGPERATLVRAINELGVGSVVHLVGYIEVADALIKEAAVLVMSSREEGLGSVVLHALSLGTPVVATRAGGLPEVVPEPWLVDVGDARALGARVVTAITQRPSVLLPHRHTLGAMVTDVVATYGGLT
jgi:glycosyltransferase involved in cell wall biosynthesis